MNDKQKATQIKQQVVDNLIADMARNNQISAKQAGSLLQETREKLQNDKTT